MIRWVHNAQKLTLKTLDFARKTHPVHESRPLYELNFTLTQRSRNQQKSPKAEHVVEEEDHDMGTDSELNTEHKVTLTQSKEDIADNILDEMTDLKAFADKPSDPIGYLRPEISSLSNKVDNLESSLAKKMFSKLEESVPRMVADAFKERMLELLSDTLKNILPNIIEESIQQALPKFDQMIQETMQSTVSKLIRKPLNKELNALNTLETQRFASLQKELVTAIRAKVRKSVRKTLWK
ncbi:hypothetical protein Tco_1266628 [Tanacetum coccineum]